MEMASSNDNFDDEPLLKNLCVLCLYTSECTRMRLRTPEIIKISWGSMPPDPPTVITAGQP